MLACLIYVVNKKVLVSYFKVGFRLSAVLSLARECAPDVRVEVGTKSNMSESTNLEDLLSHSVVSHSRVSLRMRHQVPATRHPGNAHHCSHLLTISQLLFSTVLLYSTY
jgi:hypothetical protein